MGAGNLEVVGMVNPVLAHMGGIDEIGVFLIPALLAIYALRRAERQARKRAEAEATGEALAVDDGTGSEVVPPV
jgi:hypothetical protein